MVGPDRARRRPDEAVSGAGLRILRWPGGTRRALLVHGISSSAAGWWRLGPDLADLGFDVIAPDLRGHGGSPHRGGYPMESLADDLLAVEGAPWDVVLGHSLGGAVAVVALDARPGWTRRLVLEDPALAILDRQRALAWLLEPYDAPITAERVAADNPTWHPEDARLKAEAMLQSSREVVEAIVADNPEWNLVRRAARVTVPTLVLGADPELGAVVPPALGESLSAANHLIAFQTILGASHSMHRDEYEAFFGIVAAYLGAGRPAAQ